MQIFVVQIFVWGELFKTSIPAYLAKQVCSVFYPLEVAAVALQYHFDFDRILRQQLLPPSRPMLLLHFLMMALPYAHRPLKIPPRMKCEKSIDCEGKRMLRNLFILPMVSLRLGSSETFSNLPKNPRIVLNAGSRTDFSGSTVNEHKAGSTRFAISVSKKYCCVAANAKMPATRAGGNGSRIALMNAETKTRCRTANPCR